MTTQQWILIAFVAVFTLLAAVMDLRNRKIPNWLTVTAFFAGLGYHVVTGGLSGFLTALAGFAVGFGVLFVLWLIGGGGGGDVKLMGALGTWLGAMYTIFVIVISTGLAAVFSAAVLAVGVWRGGVGMVKRKYLAKPETVRTGGNRKRRNESADEATAKRKTNRRLVPFALPVAFGTWTILIWQVIKHSS